MSGGQVLQSNRCDGETLNNPAKLERFFSRETSRFRLMIGRNCFVPGDPQVFVEPGAWSIDWYDPARHRHRRWRVAPVRKRHSNCAIPMLYGFIESAKYFEGAQTLAVKLLQPRIRSSRMMRM